MDKRFDNIINLLDSFSDLLGKEWFTRHGTSVVTYWDDWDIYYDYYKTIHEFDSRNEEQTKALFEHIKSTTKKDLPNLNYNEPGRYKQRLVFWTYLKLLNRNSIHEYSLNDNNIQISDVDRGDYFFTTGIELLQKVKLSDENFKKLNSSSMKIFFGWYVRLLFDVLNDDEINYILENINDITKHQFSVVPKVNGKIKKSICNVTYTDLIEKYFSNERNIEAIFTLTDKIINLDKNKSTINTEMEDNQFYDKFYKVFANDNNDIKDMTNAKITNLLRANFKLNLINDGCSSLIVNGSHVAITRLIEGAHIIPIWMIRNTMIDIMNMNTTESVKKEKINSIYKTYCNIENGILLPFNYHYLFDEGFISIDIESKSFVLTELGRKNEFEIFNVYGFSSNNSINEKKFEKIKEIINAYNIKVLN
ncbi:MAG: HNH endonuclease signature motif containing protein [Mycoplasma sp.]